jgi:hypothetical protein
MKKDPRKLEAKLLSNQAKPVKLRVAAAVLYQQLTGRTSDTGAGHQYLRELADTALALSHVADVYHVDARGKLMRIPNEDLAAGAFEDGGNLFRARSGTLYHSLSLRRVEMMEAIAVLKKAHIAIHGAQSASESKLAKD